MSWTSFSSFASDFVPDLMSSYVQHLAFSTQGLGNIGGVLLVYVVGIISEKTEIKN